MFNNVYTQHFIGRLNKLIIYRIRIRIPICKNFKERFTMQERFTMGATEKEGIHSAGIIAKQKCK